MANKNTLRKRAKLAKEIGRRRMEERAREKARRAAKAAEPAGM